MIKVKRGNLLDSLYVFYINVIAGNQCKAPVGRHAVVLYQSVSKVLVYDYPEYLSIRALMDDCTGPLQVLGWTHMRCNPGDIRIDLGQPFTPLTGDCYFMTWNCPCQKSFAKAVLKA